MTIGNEEQVFEQWTGFFSIARIARNKSGLSFLFLSLLVQHAMHGALTSKVARYTWEPLSQPTQNYNFDRANKGDMDYTQQKIIL